ncbi:MAG: glycosyltransferase family 2 protein [Flavobacteriia bacterium]
MPTISIITPFRNSADFIRETAESIFSQSYDDWEWILINDHSLQNEVELLKPYLRDSRVKLVRNTGKGISDALVTGFKIAEGTFVTRMDSDDIMPPDKLSVFLSSLNESGIDIVTGKVKYFSEAGIISPGYLKYEKWLNDRVDRQDFYSEIYRECSLSSGNWMMRAERLRQCGGFDGLVYPEDYDLLFRWYSFGFKIKGIDEVTHLWREHPMRTSRNSKDYSQEQFFDLKIRRFIDHDLVKAPLILNGTGTKGRLTARILLEMGIPFNWVSVEPEKFGAGIYGKTIQHAKVLSWNEHIQILNATAIDNQSIENLYSDRNSISTIFQL